MRLPTIIEIVMKRSSILKGISLTLASILILIGFFSDVGMGDPKGTGVSPERGDGQVTPFSPGERLVFQVSWLGIPAGEATLEMAETEAGEDGETYHFVSTAKTNAFLSAFFRVKDRADSHVEAATFSSKHYLLDQHEGPRDRRKEIIFDREKGKALYILNDDTPQEFDLKPGSLDSLSSLYYVRTQEMEPGSSVFVKVFDSRKNYDMEVKVLKRERLDTPLGQVDTVMVKPIMSHEGIFERKGDIYVWFTDDERRIPVKMKSKVAIGSISADLSSAEGVR